MKSVKFILPLEDMLLEKGVSGTFAPFLYNSLILTGPDLDLNIFLSELMDTAPLGIVAILI